MTEKKLRDSLREAYEKKQSALLIWANWTVWDEFAFDMKPGNKHYDFALSQVNAVDGVTIFFEWNGLKMPGIIAVSVEKLLSSDKFFNYVLHSCTEGHYEGPITLIP